MNWHNACIAVMVIDVISIVVSGIIMLLCGVEDESPRHLVIFFWWAVAVFPFSCGMV